MSQKNAKKIAEQLLVGTGVTINGSNPWDPQIHDERIYQRVLSQGTLGLGEAYMDGWWDCEQLDVLTALVLKSDAPLISAGRSVLLQEFIKAVLVNPQSIIRSNKNVSSVYDLGNDLYEAMLGRTMAYTCGYWKDAKNLDDAQDAKYDLICKKLLLKPGMTLLDVGCGWGGLLAHASQNYGAKVTGLTLSKEQASYMHKHYKGNEILLCDYRDLAGRIFDRITTVGMIEHVGPKNYKAFFKKMDELLEKDGIYLLQTIGGDNKSHRAGDAWISKYIFPGGQLPSAKQLTIAMDGIFLLEDWHSFGVYYDKTLLAWHDNFEKAWPQLESKYGERFYRMWRFYLLVCAGMFRNRKNNLWQIVMTKNGYEGGYTGVR